MGARLISRAGEVRGEFKVGEEATLGRSSRNTIVLKPELLSNTHARIWRNHDQNCYMLEDLGSSNGTRLDGETVKRAEPLGHLHVITLAEHYDFVFVDDRRSAERQEGAGLGAAALAEAVAKRVGEVSEVTLFESLPLPLPGFAAGAGNEMEESRERTIMEALDLPLPGGFGSFPDEPSAAGLAGPSDRGISAAMPVITDTADHQPAPPRSTKETREAPFEEKEVPQAAEFGDTFFLEILTDAGAQRFRLTLGENLVGRDPRADVRPGSPEVSRRHAMFVASPGRLVVRDLGSRNQTFVDGRPIQEDTELKPGQQLKFGALTARVLNTDGWED